MAKYTDNSIQFNSIDTSFMANNKKWGNGDILNATDSDLIEIATENGGKLPTIVNAVEIDWNGAKPGIGEDSTGINTTGQLLSNIKEVYSPMLAN